MNKRGGGAEDGKKIEEREREGRGKRERESHQGVILITCA